MILLLNYKIKECGVYQYGLRLYQILQKSKNINFIYKEVDSFDRIVKMINEQYDITIIKLIIPNPHFDHDISIFENIKNICYLSNVKPNIIFTTITS